MMIQGETFGSRLKKLRELAGLTPTQFAKELGVNNASISMYEQDKRMPNLRFLITLREKYKVSIDCFIDALIGRMGDDG